MKVVHIATYINGGAGTAAYRIHEALLSAGVDSKFLSTDVAIRKDSKEVFRIEKRKDNILTRAVVKFMRVTFRCGNKLIGKKYYLQYKLSRKKPDLKYEVASLPFSEYDLVTHPLVEEADIIHLHWVAGMLDYSSFFKRISKPVLWTCHDLNPFLGLFHYRADERRNALFLRSIEQQVIAVKEKAFRKSKANLKFVCPSAWLRMELTNSKVFGKCQSKNIANLVDFDVFCPRDTSAKRIELNIPDNHTIILFVSLTVSNYRKGFDLLKAALEKLNPVNVSLLTIGYATEDNFGSIPTIHLGTIDDDLMLSYYYSLADVFIIPSREDNLPNVMLEALACGTPVISFAVGGMKEFIIENVTGLLAEKVDSNSLAIQIELFLEIKHIFDRKAIRQFAFERFDPIKIANTYREVYCSMLESSNSPLTLNDRCTAAILYNNSNMSSKS